MIKTFFYSRTIEGCVKHEGYTDNMWYYYKSFSNEWGKDVWWAVDPMTGLAICKEHTKKDCITKAHSAKVLKRFSDMTNTEEYKKHCSIWYQMQVDAGIITENLIKF